MPAKKRATKKTVTENGGAEARGFAVVVEALRSDVRVVAEGVQGLREQMEAGFTEVHRRLEAHDRRFDGMDVRLDRLERGLGYVERAVLENGREIKELRHAVEALDERKVGRDEIRPTGA
jgi:hypothetical protein